LTPPREGRLALRVNPTGTADASLASWGTRYDVVLADFGSNNGVIVVPNNDMA
jgi:hypothetical protein